MPKFEVTIEREIPSYRERTTVVVEADIEDDIKDYFDFDSLDDLDLDWEEIMEGYDRFPCDYIISSVFSVENAPVDIKLNKVDNG